MDFFKIEKLSQGYSKIIQDIKISRDFSYNEIINIENTTEYKIFYGGDLMNN